MWVRLGGVRRGSVCVSVCLALKGNEFKPLWLCSRSLCSHLSAPLRPARACPWTCPWTLLSHTFRLSQTPPSVYSHVGPVRNQCTCVFNKVWPLSTFYIALLNLYATSCRSTCSCSGCGVGPVISLSNSIAAGSRMRRKNCREVRGKAGRIGRASCNGQCVHMGMTLVSLVGLTVNPTTRGG